MIEHAELLVASVAGLLGGGALGLLRGLSNKKMLDEIGRDLPTLLRDYEAAQRKASEYFEKIEEVIQERETWRTLYNDQAAGHDNAQALMLQTISALAFQYEKATGKKPKIDPIIETVRTDWSMKHSPAAREKLNDDGRLREDEQKTTD